MKNYDGRIGQARCENCKHLASFYGYDGCDGLFCGFGIEFNTDTDDLKLYYASLKNFEDNHKDRELTTLSGVCDNHDKGV